MLYSTMLYSTPQARPCSVFSVRLALWTFTAFILVATAPAVASAGLGLLKPDPSIGATFVGKGGYSADGLGQIGVGGALQADVPAGSQVVHAYLYGAYAVQGTPPGADLTLNFDGANVTLAVLQSVGNPPFLTSARADVTAQVKAKVGAGGAQVSFSVASDPSSLDGLGLVVIYSNPRLPTTTIAVLDGAASPAGDTATFSFAKPVDPTAANFKATLSLGSGHGFQGEAGHVCGSQAQQSSLVDVNGKRLTSCAGNYDDGFGANGALITVGGVGDATDNPANPNQRPADGTTPRVNDDELYDVKPFLQKGDTQLSITTSNPSGDDLVFLAIISATGEAGVTTAGGGQPPPPAVAKSFNGRVVSGVVSCRARGASAFVRVTKATQFQMGSECDTTKGTIRLTSAAGAPRQTKGDGTVAQTPTQTADFFGGRMIVTQKPSATPVTDLTLSGGDFKSTKSKCTRKKRGLTATPAADPLVRKLWGRGKGRFRTKGRYSSAAVRGTYWLTEDRCHSTVTKVREGKVLVTDNVRKKQVTVRRGQSYVAKEPSRQRRAAGSTRRTWLYRSWLPWLG
jgi:hypothetical protein